MRDGTESATTALRAEPPKIAWTDGAEDGISPSNEGTGVGDGRPHRLSQTDTLTQSYQIEKTGYHLNSEIDLWWGDFQNPFWSDDSMP